MLIRSFAIETNIANHDPDGAIRKSSSRGMALAGAQESAGQSNVKVITQNGMVT